ncbi:adenylate/guanylate cyclase domain-containing protein [Geodermatophilus sp. URMC 64]
MSSDRRGGWASWAPSGRGAVPLIVLLVTVANLVGVATVILLLIGVSDGSADTGRSTVLWTAIGYTAVALPAGTLIGMRRQRVTNAWLMAGRAPTREEAAHALRLPVDTALVAGLVWLVAAALVGVVSAAAFPDARVGFRTGIATLLGGVVTAGVTYLLVARAARAVTARALAAHPPAGRLTLGVRPRLLLTWGLTSGVPLLGLVLLVLDPSNPDGPGRAVVVFLSVVALLVGGLATLLTARYVGQPLRDLRRAVQRVGEGDYAASVVVDDAGEIGLLQEGVNSMAAGLAERERLRDLFGRHVGTTVAQRALDAGVELGGELRTAAALFVDVVGSTSLVRRTGPEQMVGLLNRFFAVVVDAVEDEGGLVNKFEGDAVLCVFGAPAEHADPAGAALRAARRICDAVRSAGELDIGVGVACGRVWAGQVGAASRLEYTVIGDPVNEAARLTELAKDHPGRAVASEPTVRAAPPEERAHWVRDADVVLRGRGEPTATWVRRLDRAPRPAGLAVRRRPPPGRAT